MKKLLCIALTIVLTITLSACSLDDITSILPWASNDQDHSAENPAPETPDVENPVIEAPNSITLNFYNYNLRVGETLQLTASATKQAGLYWKSSDERIALVNSQGLVTAVSAGAANITCYTNDSAEAACTITVEPAKEVAPPKPATTTFIFPHSSTAYLGLNEAHAKLSSMTGTPLSGSFSQDAINEIFARNGYIFQSADLVAYYSAQEWYVPDENFSIGDLNQYETANIDLLQSLS